MALPKMLQAVTAKEAGFYEPQGWVYVGKTLPFEVVE